MSIRESFILGLGNKSENFIEVDRYGKWERLTDEASKKIFEIAWNTKNIMKTSPSPT